MKRKFLTLCVTFLLAFRAKAQCAMCRAVLESEEGQSTAKGVNEGIMYLMAIPYILVAGFAFLIYWQFFRGKKESS